MSSSAPAPTRSMTSQTGTGTRTGSKPPYYLKKTVLYRLNAHLHNNITLPIILCIHTYCIYLCYQMYMKLVLHYKFGSTGIIYKFNLCMHEEVKHPPLFDLSYIYTIVILAYVIVCT